MAYLRRNYKNLELVVSHRVDGSPRIKILARFRSLDELKNALHSPKQIQALRRKASDPELDPEQLIKKGAELLRRVTHILAGAKKLSSIDTTETNPKSLPAFNSKKERKGKFQFNPSDYIKYREEFEREVEIENLLKKMIDDLEKGQNRGLLNENFVSVCRQFLKYQQAKASPTEFENLRQTVFGPKDFVHSHGYPVWSVAHGRENSSLRSLPESITALRSLIMWDTAYTQYPGHLKYREGRVEQLDLFFKTFVKWVTGKRAIR